MTRVDVDVPKTTPSRNEGARPKAPPSSSFDTVLAAIGASDETSTDHTSATPAQALAGPSVDKDHGELADRTRSFLETGPFGVARATAWNEEAPATGPCAEMVEHSVRVPDAEVARLGQDLLYASARSGAYVAEVDTAPSLARSQTPAASQHQLDIGAPKIAGASPTGPALRAKAGVPSEGSAHRTSRQHALPQARPNALSLRLRDEAGGVAVRITLPRNIGVDAPSLADEVERALSDHNLDGALYVNGRRILSRKESFDV